MNEEAEKITDYGLPAKASKDISTVNFSGIYGYRLHNILADGLLLSFLALTVWHSQHVLGHYEPVRELAWLLAIGLDAGIAFAAFVASDRQLGRPTRITAIVWLIGLVSASYGLNVAFYMGEQAEGWSWALAAFFPASLAFLGAIKPGLAISQNLSPALSAITVAENANDYAKTVIDNAAEGLPAQFISNGAVASDNFDKILEVAPADIVRNLTDEITTRSNEPETTETAIARLCQIVRQLQRREVGVKEFDQFLHQLLVQTEIALPIAGQDPNAVTEIENQVKQWARQVQRRELRVKEFDRQLQTLLSV